jgi:Flp pilus assembly protein TadD
MKLSVTTLEQLAQHYTTAAAALGELARAYAMHGRLGLARRLLHAALQSAEDDPAHAHDRLQLLLLY